MAQKVTGYIKLQIEAGKATPPLLALLPGQKGVTSWRSPRSSTSRTKNQMGYAWIPVVINVR